MLGMQCMQWIILDLASPMVCMDTSQALMEWWIMLLSNIIESKVPVHIIQKLPSFTLLSGKFAKKTLNLYENLIRELLLLLFAKKLFIIG